MVTNRGHLFIWVFPCCEETPREKKRYLSGQNSVLGFVKSPSSTRASPPVLLDIGDDYLDDWPTVRGGVPPPSPENCHSFVRFNIPVNFSYV